MNEETFSGKLSEEIINSTRVVPGSLKDAIEKAAAEAEGLEKKVLEKIVENCRIASASRVPVCQDTGVFEIWLNIGKDASVKGIDFSRAVSAALKEAHEKGGLRRSMDPEIAGAVHISFCGGAAVEAIITPRGFGSENYTFLRSLPPGASDADVKEAVIEETAKASARPCPPYVIGVGLGGTASSAVELSAKALTEIDFSPSGLEKEILDGINLTGTGAGGMGGRFTAIGIKIKRMPAHIAGLPLCVHVGCWCNRVSVFKIETD